MARPTPKPYAPVSLELLDAIILAHFPATQAQIVWSVIRKTVGDYQKPSAPISESLLKQMTGRSRHGIHVALGDLVKQGVVRIVQQARGCRPAILRLNEDYETWGRYSVSQARVTGRVRDLSDSSDAMNSPTPLAAHPDTPLDTYSASPTIDIEEDLGVRGPGGDKVPRSEAPSGFSPCELARLKPHVLAALRSHAFGPEVPKEIRAAVRRGQITEAAVASW